MVIVSGGFQREIISTAKFEHHALLSTPYFNLGGYIVDSTAIQPFYEYGSLLVPRTLYPHNCRNGEGRVEIKIAIIGYIQEHSPLNVNTTNKPSSHIGILIKRKNIIFEKEYQIELRIKVQRIRMITREKYRG